MEPQPTPDAAAQEGPGLPQAPPGAAQPVPPAPLRLELEPPAARPARAQPEGVALHGAAPPGAEPQGPAAGREASTLTFAEKQGRAVPRVAGVRDWPPGWPGEALAFPGRGPGRAWWALASAGLLALDLLGWVPGLAFLGWLLKVPALLFVLRWQLDLVGMSAAGHDTPSGFGRALALERGDVRSFATFLAWALAWLAPGLLLAFVGPRLHAWQGAAGWGVPVLLVLGGMGVALLALARAVGEPWLARPWWAALWMAQRPLVVLAASAGWWGLGGAEWALARLAREGGWPLLPVGVLVRAASVWGLVACARALGVLGRRVDPQGHRPA
ncbi:MAG: hypothetical protein ACKOSS_05510 [Planctomycetia bacterium]